MVSLKGKYFLAIPFALLWLVGLWVGYFFIYHTLDWDISVRILFVAGHGKYFSFHWWIRMVLKGLKLHKIPLKIIWDLEILEIRVGTFQWQELQFFLLQSWRYYISFSEITRVKSKTFIKQLLYTLCINSILSEEGSVCLISGQTH